MTPLFRSRNFWITLISIVVIVILFAVLVDWGQVVSELRQANPWLLFASLGLLLAGILAYTERWRRLFSAAPAWWPTFHVSNAGSLINLLLPVRPGDVTRIFMLSQVAHPSAAETTSSLLVERWLEQVMRLLAFGGALMFGVVLRISTLSVAGAVALLALTLVGVFWLVAHREQVLESWPAVLARLPRVEEDRAHKILNDLLLGLQAASSPRLLFIGFGWSLVTWGLFWFSQYVALLALRPGMPVDDMLAISLGALALAPPSAPAMPGVYQASVVVPLTLVGFNREFLTAYAVVLQALQLISIGPLGIWGISHSGFSWSELLGEGEKESRAPEAEEPAGDPPEGGGC